MADASLRYENEQLKRKLMQTQEERDRAMSNCHELWRRLNSLLSLAATASYTSLSSSGLPTSPSDSYDSRSKSTSPNSSSAASLNDSLLSTSNGTSGNSQTSSAPSTTTNVTSHANTLHASSQNDNHTNIKNDDYHRRAHTTQNHLHSINNNTTSNTTTNTTTTSTTNATNLLLAHNTNINHNNNNISNNNNNNQHHHISSKQINDHQNNHQSNGQTKTSNSSATISATNCTSSTAAAAAAAHAKLQAAAAAAHAKLQAAAKLSSGTQNGRHNGDTHQPLNLKSINAIKDINNNHPLIAEVAKVTTVGEIEEIAPGQFKCRYCDKTFDRIFSVHRHERVHTGFKPCVCRACGRGFSEKRNLRHHIIRFHSDGTGRELLKRNRNKTSSSLHHSSGAGLMNGNHNHNDISSRIPSLMDKGYDSTTSAQITATLNRLQSLKNEPLDTSGLSALGAAAAVITVSSSSSRRRKSKPSKKINC